MNEILQAIAQTIHDHEMATLILGFLALGGIGTGLAEAGKSAMDFRRSKLRTKNAELQATLEAKSEELNRLRDQSIQAPALTAGHTDSTSADLAAQVSQVNAQNNLLLSIIREIRGSDSVIPTIVDPALRETIDHVIAQNDERVLGMTQPPRKSKSGRNAR